MSEIKLTVGGVQACLRQILMGEFDLTAEQRYSLQAAVEAVGFMGRISGPLKKAVKQHGNGNSNSSSGVGVSDGGSETS